MKCVTGKFQHLIEQMKELPEMEGYEKPDAKKGASGTAIELKNVSQTYFKRGIFGERTFTAFKGLNLKFERSTVYGLTGPSGCGKSTTIKFIYNYYWWILRSWFTNCYK